MSAWRQDGAGLEPNQPWYVEKRDISSLERAAES